MVPHPWVQLVLTKYVAMISIYSMPVKAKINNSAYSKNYGEIVFYRRFIYYDIQPSGSY